ncbi:MAG: matrixin family metalloprotease [Bacteroidota bacterium]
MRKYLIIICLFLFGACRDDEENVYRPCDQEIFNRCPGSGDDSFCTLGYKWGGSNPYENAGRSISGPAIAGGTVTYAFQDEGYKFSTHSQSGLVSQSINSLSSCGKEKIREAFAKWEAVANISFEEIEDPEISDIKIIVADIEQGGLGYPAYVGSPCEDIAGQMIFNIPIRGTCDRFLNLALHEIGHVLGLGHVGSQNIMNPDWNDNITDLQTGDIEGVQSIYGTK